MIQLVDIRFLVLSLEKKFHSAVSLPVSIAANLSASVKLPKVRFFAHEAHELGQFHFLLNELSPKL